MARQMKETSGNWVMTRARFVPVGGVEPEEAEEAEQADSSLEARLEKAMAEVDYEREQTFRYLKEYRKQKRHKQKLERDDRAREEMRIEMDRVLQADAERSRKSEATTREIGSGGEMAAKRTSAQRRSPARGMDYDIPYVRDENGELVPYDGIQYVEDVNGALVRYVPPPPRQFTEEDRKRANKNRDRYTRAAWGKKLRAIAEGRVTVTKEQFQAHLAYGRFRGWNRRPLGQR